MITKSSKLFFLALLILVLFSVALTFYKKVVLHDFNYLTPEEVKPSTESLIFNNE